MEPVLIGLAPALITGAIAAVANVLKAFHVGDITDDQIEAINAAVLPIMLVLGAIGTWYARSKVTPVEQPKLPQGTTVEVVTPGNAPNESVTV